MLISSGTAEKLKNRLTVSKEVFCKGLFLSARWFVLAQVAENGTHVVVLPDRDSAEYCSGDLYNLVEGDVIFYMPDTGKGVEKSNFKSSLSVQRTAALGKLMNSPGTDDRIFIVTYPEALEEPVPAPSKVKSSLLKIRKGDEISYDKIRNMLAEQGFERVDFVSQPGQFAVRGSIIDIFSYSNNDPFRVSFFGNEIENIHVFDSNTQLSKEERDAVDIFPDLVNHLKETGIPAADLFPEDTLLWLDSSDMYRKRDFFRSLDRFRKVYIDTPLAVDNDTVIPFNIAPQPVFNKNFELLTADIREKLENNYKVCIFSEKNSQIERLKSILVQNGGLVPDFVAGKNIHAGFIDHENKICCYSDHEIFDRFHRVNLRRTVDKSEQLTLNDLSAFNIGDYVVHIDHGVGIFGGLVRMRDDKDRVHEVVKLMYKDGDGFLYPFIPYTKFPVSVQKTENHPKSTNSDRRGGKRLKPARNPKSKILPRISYNCMQNGRPPKVSPFQRIVIYRKNLNPPLCTKTRRIKKRPPVPSNRIWRMTARWIG